MERPEASKALKKLKFTWHLETNGYYASIPKN